MRRLLILSILTLSVGARAADDESDLRAKAKAEKAEKDAELKKKATIAPDKSLAGDITRKKATQAEAAPALQYDTFRLGIESQVATKRTAQIKDLQKIIELTPPSSEEAPGLYFRLGELYWEESKFYFFQANRKDDDRINAMNAGDKAGEQRALQEKESLIGQSKDFAGKAVEQYATIVQNYKKFPRTDEVLYFLGKNLIESGDEKRGLLAFKRLIEKYSKSKFVADAYLAYGEYYFEASKGKHDMLEKALESYKSAANYPENQAYGFAVYKQGWCFFNLGDYHKAMDQFRAVILYTQLDADADKTPVKKGGKTGLAKEARNDFVRAFERAAEFGPGDAKAEFAKLSDKPDERFLMLKQLANLYYEDGKDKEAALTFNMLIKEKPLSPEAPGFQAKIVDCVLRAGNKKMTLQQVRQLVRVIQDVEKSGSVKEDKDKKALAEARELAERTLSNLAVNWHNEAKKTRDDETFALSSEVYSDYLVLFPDNPKAYDLRFFWAELLNDNLQKFEQAAEQYTKVLLVDAKRIEEKAKPGKFMVNAAYNAILAYDEVVKAAESSGKLKMEPSSDASKKIKIPPEKQNLVDACERYLKYVPKGDKRVEIAFKVANIYYRHNYLDEAVARFAEIALKHPDYKFENGDLAGEISANLILDSYNLLQDFDKLLEWAYKFIAEPKLAPPGGKFHEYLQKLIETVTFKRATQLDQKKEYAKAAEAYRNFVEKFPGSDLACKALFNASIGYFHSHALDKSIEMRRRIIKEHPKCEFVPACIYANAEGDEAVANFQEAAHYYEAYASGYAASLSGKGKHEAAEPAHKPRHHRNGHHRDEAAVSEHEKQDVQVWDEGKAQISQYNAGIFREALGEYKKALEDRTTYLRLWPESADFEKVFLSIADLHEKHGKFADAQKQYEEYEKRNSRDSNKILMAEGKIAGIYEKKMHREKEADKIYSRVWGYYESLPQKTRKALDDTALAAVGRARYLRCEDDWKKYKELKPKWTKFSLTNERVLKAGIQELQASFKDKNKGLDVVKKCYTETVQYKSAEPAICALYRIGEALNELADSVVKLKMPKGVTPELEDNIREQFAPFVDGPKKGAAEAFAAAVEKARELDVFNDCSNKALAQLRDSFMPEKYPPMLEDRPEFKVSTATRAVGDDLLQNIEAVPVLTPQQREENRAKAEAVARKTKDLSSKVKDQEKPSGASEEVDPTPEAEDPPPKKEANKVEGAAAMGTGPATKPDEEPRDNP